MPKHIERLRARIRPGEGFAISVVSKTQPRPDGTAVLELGMDLTEAPVPDRRYVADLAWVDYAHGMARLMFGQRKIGGTGLRSLVVLSMTEEAVVWFLQTCREFLPSVKSFAEQARLAPASLTEPDEEPAQTVALVASIVAAAFAGRETCLDFYHLSPWSMRALAAPGTSQVALDPVVRVSLATALFLAIMPKLEELRDQFAREERT